ncbi:hypothetical protein U5U50_01690 [Mycoplasma sp. 888]|uniref:hypothetical protein n=1 Tax=Mycoplasma sp. 888 TaxID=3108483 RepID=UPI002D7962EC|nr:hypothetical protein [Mycoplasma sp. 888]WRQ26094.1 hypothetical protein U5U50_01690 [Mycoplasma sp. 888]
MKKIKEFFRKVVDFFKWMKVHSIDAVITVLESVPLEEKELLRLKEIINKNDKQKTA